MSTTAAVARTARSEEFQDRILFIVQELALKAIEKADADKDALIGIFRKLRTSTVNLEIVACCVLSEPALAEKIATDTDRTAKRLSDDDLRPLLKRNLISPYSELLLP